MPLLLTAPGLIAVGQNLIAFNIGGLLRRCARLRAVRPLRSRRFRVSAVIHDAIVVLGMLIISFRSNPIAGRSRIPRKSDILFVYLTRVATNPAIGTVAVICTRATLATTVLFAVVRTTARSPTAIRILLSHRSLT